MFCHRADHSPHIPSCLIYSPVQLGLLKELLIKHKSQIFHFLQKPQLVFTYSEATNFIFLLLILIFLIFNKDSSLSQRGTYLSGYPMSHPLWRYLHSWWTRMRYYKILRLCLGIQRATTLFILSNLPTRLCNAVMVGLPIWYACL